MTKIVHFNVRSALLAMQYFKVIIRRGLPFRFQSLEGKGWSGLQYSCHISCRKCIAHIVRDAVTCMFVLGMHGEKVVDVHPAFMSQLHFS